MIRRTSKGVSFVKRGILKVIYNESKKTPDRRFVSKVIWDVFTGSASYGNIFLRMICPSFVVPLIAQILFGGNRETFSLRKSTFFSPRDNVLGRAYQDGDTIIKQGEEGNEMYVIQSGAVEVIREEHDREILLAELGESEFFGEMALFEKTVRSSTIRANGPVSVLTVDKHTLLKNIQDNPSLAFRLLEKMSNRLREADNQLVHTKGAQQIPLSGILRPYILNCEPGACYIGAAAD